MDIAAHIIVKGLVQGVGYRYFVYSKAALLKLTGYTKNLYNGDVEIVVEGDRSLIEELIKEVRIGPSHSRVVDVIIEWVKPSHSYHHFSIK